MAMFETQHSAKSHSTSNTSPNLYIADYNRPTIIFLPCRLLWSPYVIGQTIIFLPCDYYLSFFPRLISAAVDWMSTILPHMVWP